MRLEFFNASIQMREVRALVPRLKYVFLNFICLLPKRGGGKNLCTPIFSHDRLRVRAPGRDCNRVSCCQEGWLFIPPCPSVSAPFQKGRIDKEMEGRKCADVFPLDNFAGISAIGQTAPRIFVDSRSVTTWTRA